MGLVHPFEVNNTIGRPREAAINGLGEEIDAFVEQLVPIEQVVVGAILRAKGEALIRAEEEARMRIVEEVDA